MRNIVTFNIHDNASSIGLDGKILTYRPDGKRLQQCLLQQCKKDQLIGFINLDFYQVEVCDVSFIDELVFELSTTLRSLKFGAVIFLSNLDEYVYDSLRAKTTTQGG